MLTETPTPYPDFQKYFYLNKKSKPFVMACMLFLWLCLSHLPSSLHSSLNRPPYSYSGAFAIAFPLPEMFFPGLHITGAFS